LMLGGRTHWKEEAEVISLSVGNGV
jgi:hypothetical protein